MLLIVIMIVLNLSGCVLTIFDAISSAVNEVTEFEEGDKKIMQDNCGFVLPFVVADEYEFEALDYGYYYAAAGVLTQDYLGFIEDFDERFRLVRQRNDYYGDTWYTYFHNGWYMDAGIEADAIGVKDTLVYLYPSSYMIEGVETNYGAGLPTSEGGILNVDFSAIENSSLKQLSDNKYACPSTGEVNVLVIPICFEGESEPVSYLATLDRMLNDEGSESVSKFLYNSSFGKLDLTFDVYDSWISAPYSADEYLAYFEQNPEDATQMNSIMLTALTQLESELDLAKYDSDSDGYIDAVIMVNNLEVNSDNLLQWAYKSQNIITNLVGENYSFDDKNIGNYVWISKDFLKDEKGNPDIKTLLHEFMHTMGVIDYYSTDYWLVEDPVFGVDLMSDKYMDNSPFTKLSLGWITDASLLTDPKDAQIKLENFWTSGDMLLFANDFDEDLGCFQEYFIVIYSKGSDAFADGLVFYHIDASLYKGMLYNQTIEIVYNDNDSYIGGGTENNLVELVKINKKLSLPVKSGQKYTFEEYDNKGGQVSLDFEVTVEDAQSVVITFKNGQ